jgi:predicted nucleic acid-binding protein
MALLVSDANIFMDLEVAGLLEYLFGLEETIAVPDVLFEDELKHWQPHLPRLGLCLMTLGSRAVMRTVSLARTYRRPSRLDLAALALAEQEGCPLVTGDRALRDAALREKVPVYGTLWLVERMVDIGQIGVERAADAYDKMQVSGRRLPWDEVERQLARLRRP